MSLLSDLLKPGFTALGAITGDPFRYEGVSGYFGTFDAERLEYGMAEVGQTEIVRRNLLALKSQWLEKPDVSQGPEIVFGADTYILAAVAEDGVHYLFTLEKRT